MELQSSTTDFESHLFTVSSLVGVTLELYIDYSLTVNKFRILQSLEINDINKHV